MHPDSLMPVQGTGLGSSNPRPIRTLILLTAGAGLALWLAAPHSVPNVKTPAPVSVTVVTTTTSIPCDCSSNDDPIVTLCRQGNFDQAVSLATEKLRTSTDNSTTGELHFLRAGAYRLMGKETEARADYASAAAMSGSGIIGEDEVDLRMHSGDWNTAKHLAEKVIKDNAGSCEVNNACWDLAMSGDPAQAARVMKSIVANDSDAAYLDTYAWSLYLSGHRQEAVAEEQKAVENAGSNECLSAYYESCLKGMEGSPAQAQQELKKLFQDDITNTDRWAAASHFNKD